MNNDDSTTLSFESLRIIDHSLINCAPPPTPQIVRIRERLSPYSACSDSLNKHHGGVNVTSKNGGTQTVMGRIGPLNDFIQGAEFKNLLNWSKNLRTKLLLPYTQQTTKWMDISIEEDSILILLIVIFLPLLWQSSCCPGPRRRRWA